MAIKATAIVATVVYTAIYHAVAEGIIESKTATPASNIFIDKMAIVLRKHKHPVPLVLAHGHNIEEHVRAFSVRLLHQRSD